MINELPRIPSGIPGLDEMVEGGFPFPSIVLVAGTAGTGKTTFALQFLFQGARRGDMCLYFTTLSEPPQWMLRFAAGYSFVDEKYFGHEIKWVDLAQVIGKKREPDAILKLLEDEIISTMPQRIVIDPVSVIEYVTTDYRVFLFELTNMLKNWQAVTLLTGETIPEESYRSDLVCTVDAVVLLFNTDEEGWRRRYLEVLKMRGTDHLMGRRIASISKDGIAVHPSLRLE